MKHWEDAHKYALAVVADQIPACKWVKLACQRQLDDLKREKFAYRYDHARANKICSFIELLPHTKSQHWSGAANFWRAGKPITLEPWQKFLLCTVFGWVHKETGRRRFKTAYVEVPRKNAKSTISSGIGLYMLTEDREMGAEVYSAATTRDQAKIVFEDAQRMARKTPELCEHYGVAVNAHNVNVVGTASKFEALSADHHSLDGLNIHCGIIDELHAHKTRHVWDVIETATGARSQPLLWAITTAGSDRTGICYEQRTYVTKLLERVAEDETYFGVIYTVDEGDDPLSMEGLRKANPNFGVSVNPEDLERKVRKALSMPSAVNNVLTKHANVWVNADEALFDIQKWHKLARPISIEQFQEYPCWIGLDLGFVDDIASFVVRFRLPDDKYAVFGRHYLPEATVEDSRNSSYSGWVRSGHLITTDGSVTDLRVILSDIADMIANYDVRKVSFDPYGKLQFYNLIQEVGIDLARFEEYPVTVPKMSPATEVLMKEILEGSITHDGDPVLTWGLSNVVGHFDAKDNVFPRRENAAAKIDPAIAAIIATGSEKSEQPARSRYETEEVFALG